MNLLFLGTSADTSFLPRLKGVVGSAKCFVITNPIQTLYEVVSYCAKRDITGVITTSAVCLSKLLPPSNSTKLPSIDNYAGSFFTYKNIDFVIVNPLDHLISVPYGEFITRRYVSKLTNPAKWVQQSPAFNWTILNASTLESEYQRVKDFELCSVDIETYKENLAIRCIGFTFLRLVRSTGNYESRSMVLPLDSDFAVVYAQKFLSLGCAKIFQNGKYDLNYLLRYGIVPVNYVWDTAALMHCWYSELPKDLGSLSSFFVRESVYWKDLAHTSDLEQYYLYNARDTHQTALAFLGWIAEAPVWARRNYLMEFPLQFPCILAEMTGIKRDIPRLEKANEQFTEKIEVENEKLSSELGVPYFNTNSPKQKRALLTVLGCHDLESTDETSLSKARLRHPLNARLLSQVSSIQKARKLLSTYLCVDENSKEYNGRILYALNPHGTDTARLASREHHFWCGLQIHNIPRGREVKQTFISDEGFLFGKCDLEQAESRDTAYITGDPNLIAAVSSGKDFHSTNASSFFGVPYARIYDDAAHEVVDVKLRDLAKRVNHGASYNMGWFVLIDTMGEDKIAEARTLLRLPSAWSLRQVAEHLLNKFTLTYPAVRIDYQNWVTHTVSATRLLVGATGWTRYCFGDPTKSKQALNAYIAHCPQSLNATKLNRAWMACFYQLALPHSANFKLCAQIHDEILFQYRVGHEHLAHKVKELMEIEISVKDIKGTERKYTVPASLKIGKQHWNEL